MIKLQKEFTANVDRAGDNIFREVSRTGDVALYQRFTMDEKHRSYEVFVVRTIKAGTPLPGGGQVQEDYERYPTKNDFGKKAWCPVTLEAALARFNALVNDAIEIEDSDEEETVPVVKVTAVVEPTELKIPSGKFTHAELADLNGKTRPQVYAILQNYLKDGKLKQAGNRPSASGKGKPANLFEKA